MNNDQMGIDESSQEEIMQQKILAQRKEKKIKIIRILTVITYLMSVSTVAAMLSAYYIFIWNPYVGNATQTPNTEGMVLALRRVSGEYVFANTADREYSENENFASEESNNHKANDHPTSPESSIIHQTSIVKLSKSHMQITGGNFTKPFTPVKN